MANKTSDININLGLDLLENDKIRRTVFNGTKYYVIADLVLWLTEREDTKDYISKMRKKDRMLSRDWRALAPLIPIKTNGGTQKIKCATVEGVFRLVQSIQTPKAEVLKEWLAKLAFENINALKPEMISEPEKKEEEQQ